MPGCAAPPLPLVLLLWASATPQHVTVPETASVRASADTTIERRGEWIALPFVSYAPETSFAAGGVVGHYRRLEPAPETSSFLAALTVTTRKQLIIEWLPDVYLPGGTRVGGTVRFRHFPDVFYGVGPGTPEDAEEAYTSRVTSLEARAQRPLVGALRAGVATRVRHERIVRTEDGGALAAGEVRGSEGGTVVGIGAIGTWDTRDNLFAPRRGRYVEASWVVHDGVLGSDFDFHRVVVDARQFHPIGEGSALGLQVYGEATPGRAPFSLLPPLGGSQRMRGYREGRFRDRVLVAVQSELRFPLWRRFGGVAFAAAGDVAPRIPDLDLSSLEVTGGAGLRFRLTDEGVTLRGDFALGREGGQLYFTLGHAF